MVASVGEVQLGRFVREGCLEGLTSLVEASEMYLTKISPRTMCLYSAASMEDRSLSAAAQRVFFTSWFMMWPVVSIRLQP